MVDFDKYMRDTSVVNGYLRHYVEQIDENIIIITDLPTFSFGLEHNKETEEVAAYIPELYMITFNYNVYILDPEYFLNEILPHELAHFVDHLLADEDYVSNHDATFQLVLKKCFNREYK